VTDPSSAAPSGAVPSGAVVPGADPLGVDPFGVDPFDDWGELHGALPADLLFECTAVQGGRRQGVAVFRDRVVVTGAGADDRTVPLGDVSGWRVTREGDLVAVELDGEPPCRTCLPSAYGGAVTVALREALQQA